jgi:hypothetical protein
MKKAVFWDVAPCRYYVNRRFGGTYRLHLQGRRKKKKIRERGTSASRCPPKRQLTQYLHGATLQKTAFSIRLLFVSGSLRISDRRQTILKYLLIFLSFPRQILG